MSKRKDVQGVLCPLVWSLLQLAVEEVLKKSFGKKPRNGKESSWWFETYKDKKERWNEEGGDEEVRRQMNGSEKHQRRQNMWIPPTLTPEDEPATNRILQTRRHTYF